MLHAEGARITVADINGELAGRVSGRFGTDMVSPEEIYRTDAEIFSPCALGCVLNSEVIPELRCRIVAGAANNQLGNEGHGKDIWERGILYSPDYVINAGGLISALLEMGMCDSEEVMQRTGAIYDRLKTVFDKSRTEMIPTNQAADRIAEDRIRTARESRASSPKN